MNYSPDWDLATIPEKVFAKERARRHGKKGGRKIKDDPATEEKRATERQRVAKYRARLKKPTLKRATEIVESALKRHTLGSMTKTSPELMKSLKILMNNQPVKGNNQ